MATLDSLIHYFPNALLHINGSRFHNPIERFELGSGDRWSGHSIDLQAILRNTSPRQIILAGYFQRFEYFRPHLNEIRNWFYVRDISTPYTIGARDVVVNIRRGEDFSLHNWTLSAAYYDRIMAGLSAIGQVYICGIGIDANTRTYWQRYQPIFYDATPIEHFAFIKRFKRIVLSNSTFAWWAALLSDATEVYAPRSLDGRAYGFTGYKDVDLHTGAAGYVEVPDGELST